MHSELEDKLKTYHGGTETQRNQFVSAKSFVSASWCHVLLRVSVIPWWVF